MGSRTTLRDVARFAGVSPFTVTLLATGGYRESPAVAERVRKAAAELGVDLQRWEKAIAIGFLLSNREMLHPFHSRILAGAEAYCAARDHYILFLPYRYLFNTPWRELQVPQIWRRRDIIWGCIVTGVTSQNLLDLLSHEEIPFTVLGNNVIGEWRHEEYDGVWFEDIQASYELTQYL
jgi:DNA-binding LacI/PurR family transcriptional regulator